MPHEYPADCPLDSMTEDRVTALAGFGFTQRQREFLVTVMVHAGCFLERQYCAFTGTARGQNSRDFIARLVARGCARAIAPRPARRGRLYHVHHKPLYEAIGQADNRNRRAHTLGRMVERVMILDAVLGDRRCWWLSPEGDKQRFFGLRRDNSAALTSTCGAAYYWPPRPDGGGVARPRGRRSGSPGLRVSPCACIQAKHWSMNRSLVFRVTFIPKP